jgi:hypothetical protein
MLRWEPAERENVFTGVAEHPGDLRVGLTQHAGDLVELGVHICVVTLIPAGPRVLSACYNTTYFPRNLEEIP